MEAVQAFADFVYRYQTLIASAGAILAAVIGARAIIGGARHQAERAQELRDAEIDEEKRRLLYALAAGAPVIHDAVSARRKTSTEVDKKELEIALGALEVLRVEVPGSILDDWRRAPILGADIGRLARKIEADLALHNWWMEFFARRRGDPDPRRFMADYRRRSDRIVADLNALLNEVQRHPLYDGPVEAAQTTDSVDDSE